MPELDAERYADLIRVRVRLECLAVEWATARIELEQLEHLDRLIDTMARANAAGDTRSYVRANHKFHFTIYEAAGSETLLSIIEGLWLQVSPYFHLLYDSGSYLTGNEEHRCILTALRQRKSAKASLHLKRDIESATKVLIALLSQKGVPGRSDTPVE